MKNLNIHIKLQFLLILITLVAASFAQNQRDVIIPPNEPFGEPSLNGRGRMNGNRVSETFENHGEIGYYDIPGGRGAIDFSGWPKGSGHPYLDGIAVVVGASVLDIFGNRVHSVQANYREEVDRSPDLETIWGWHPIPGYLNESREPLSPAMSNDPTTWPVEWPDHPDWKDNMGQVEWNGRFGRGRFNAQLESYYVMDDAVDKEFAFYPDPSDTTRGGLGLRGAIRLYQWVHPLAQDNIFGEFWITNIGQNDLDSTGFGWWVDNGIGGTGFDHGLFDLQEDLSIAYDNEDVGIWGGPAGIAGYGYLESPGIHVDMIDNDNDGIINERRDNDAGIWLEDPLMGPDGTVIDPDAFFEWYGYEPRAHWEGDEDQDWVGFDDVNENKIYDEGEAINDDVGSDGVGPDDLNYFGPDLDGTEGNGQPDQGEPNFGRVDNDESDQLGMTSFRMIDNPGHPNPQPNRFQPFWFSDDETWWTWLSTHEIIPDPVLTAANLNMVFATGVFPLQAGRTERFSMALARTLGSGTDISAMLEAKQTIQAIYNTDYQFAQPPIKPKLTAVPGDGKVTLFWDNVAELSKDPFLGKNVHDFSGYRIYRATDPNFNEVTIITDEDGQPIIKKPLAIFDLDDGFKGAHPLLVNGAPYDMGNESGLQHRYEDLSVSNGITYYYSVVAFDTGAVKRGLGPSENTTIIEVNSIGDVQFVDRNCAAVIPRAPVAGYRKAKIDAELPLLITRGEGTGSIVDIEVTNPLEFIEGIFHISFTGEMADGERLIQTTEYEVSQLQGDEFEKIINSPWVEDTAGFGATSIFNGMIVSIKNDAGALDSDNTGWLEEDSTTTSSRNGLNVTVIPDSGVIGAAFLFPHSDIELQFSSTALSTSSRGRGPRKFLNGLSLNMQAVAADTSILSLSIIDEDSSDTFELEKDAIEIWENINNRRRTYWVVRFRANGSYTMPSDGDVLRIASKKQFETGDYFEIQTIGENINQEEAKSDLNRVAVVPNPYIITNPAEPGDPFLLGQERRLQFIHLPAQCTIRIFTLSGKLVEKIEVNNPLDDGHILWDLRNQYDLEVAPGIYIFHVKDELNGATKVGRFAIIR